MRIRRFWFDAIGITVMLAVLFAMALALATAMGAVAFGQRCRSVRVRKGADFFGGAHDAIASQASQQIAPEAGDCVRMCLKQGYAWALVDGEDLYAEGDSPVLDRLAGERVSVSGTWREILSSTSVESQNR